MLQQNQAACIVNSARGLCCMDRGLVAGGRMATHIRKPIHLPETTLPCRSNTMLNTAWP